MNARITKNELIAINASLSAENAALRAKVSELSATVEAALGTPGKRTAAQLQAHQRKQAAELKAEVLKQAREFRSNREVVTERHVKRHAYADRAEAVANCKRLVSSELNQRYVFSVQGNEVIAKERVL